MAKNFPNLMKNIVHIWEAQWTTSRINLKRSTPQINHNQISKDKGRILKAKRNHWLQGILSKINSWFLVRNHGGQKAILKEKSHGPGFLYPVKLSFRNEGQIWVPGKQKLRKLLISLTSLIDHKPALQGVLKRIPQTKKKGH